MDGTAGLERDPLTRDRIARTALAFVDEHGLEALSMRKLASALGFEAMSLYNHVDNKDHLLDELAELLWAEMLDLYGERPADGGWEADAFAVAEAFRSVVLRHPSAVTLVTQRPIRGEQGTRFLGVIEAVFTGLGLSPVESNLAFSAASAYVIGWVTNELGLVRAVRSGAVTPPPPFPRQLAPDDEPGPVDDQRRFDWGLRALLTGILAQVGHDHAQLLDGSDGR